MNTRTSRDPIFASFKVSHAPECGPAQTTARVAPSRLHDTDVPNRLYRKTLKFEPQMTIARITSCDELLIRTGFVRDDGSFVPGVVDLTTIHEQVDTHLRYDSLLRTNEASRSSTDFIYETPRIGIGLSVPCGYFACYEHEPPHDEIAELRRNLWNHGQIPTLCVITPTKVRVYDAFARPAENDAHDPKHHLLGQLEIIADRLRGLTGFNRANFDDNSFWDIGPGRKIASDQRVDLALLKDLQDTRDLLCKYGLNSADAHTALSRVVFVKYLEDRGILRPEDFNAHGGATDFKDLLSKGDGMTSFFEWLHDKFNGDMFLHKTGRLMPTRSQHLSILQRFLSGDEMIGYPNSQRRLWPYSFELIPVELISSIYEMFAHSADPGVAESRSVHYTKPSLVSMTLSLAMGNLDGSARVLDPACGSGVFLVEAFRRLVWAKQCMRPEPLSRTEILETLQNQIFGIDVDRDAINITAFSLYLAFMELVSEARPVGEVRLPNLLSRTSDDQHQNLYVQDFMNLDHWFNKAPPFAERNFDLIVSNPPWTAWTEDSAPVDPDNPDRNIRWGLRFATEHRIPDKKADQAFLTRARDFCNDSSRVAMIVASRMFHQMSGTGVAWRKRFFEENSIRHVVDLSDLVGEQLLFGPSRRSPSQNSKGTQLPASVLIFTPKKPDRHTSFQYLAPKRYPGIRHRREIQITSSDIQTLTQRVVADDPHFPWTALLRGSARDVSLLYRLRSLSTLEVALDQAGKEAPLQRGSGLTFGNKEQRDASHFTGIPFLPGDWPNQRFSLDIRTLPEFSKPKVARRSSNRAFNLPALILARSLIDGSPAVAFVSPTGNLRRLVFAHTYFCISFDPQMEWLAHRLNAILNSELPLYYAFMTGSELGVGRRLIEIKDWYQVPVPEDLLDNKASRWDRVLELEEILRTNSLDDGAKNQYQTDLNQEVCALYSLSNQERIVVNDTMNYVIKPYFSRRSSRVLGSATVTWEQLEQYANRICSQLNGILHYANQSLSPTVFEFQDSAPLAVCRFSLSEGNDAVIVHRVSLPGLDALLAQMSGNLNEHIADNLLVQRDLLVYDNEGFWVIKPPQERLWAESVALNDADSVFAEHLRAGIP